MSSLDILGLLEGNAAQTAAAGGSARVVFKGCSRPPGGSEEFEMSGICHLKGQEFGEDEPES